MSRAVTIALAPLSLIYGAVISTRSALYRRGVFRTHRISAPVISVGNLTTGGTGKTPLVEWLARRLAERGRRVCVLTRGYGRSDSHQRVVVCDGNQILGDVVQSGDEAMMLAEALQGSAAIVCDADRVSAANWVIQNLKSDVIILDDGFQHLRLARDFDIVTIDATNPSGSGWLLPAGMLREPISALKRADCIVLTRVTDASDEMLQAKIRLVTDAPVLTSRTVIQRVLSLNETEGEIDNTELRGQPVAAFCAIGNPSAFFEQLQNENFDLRHTASFRDHHNYSQSDIDWIVQESIARGAHALLTTAKDAVKLGSLRFEFPCYMVEIKIEISEADGLLSLIDQSMLAHR